MIKHNHSLRGYCSHGPFAYDAMDEADMKNCGITRKFCYYIDGNTYKVPLLPWADSHFKVSHGGVTYGAVNLDPQVTVGIIFDNEDPNCTSISTNIALNNSITVQARNDPGDDWSYFADLEAGSYSKSYGPDYTWVYGGDIFYARIIKSLIRRDKEINLSFFYTNTTPSVLKIDAGIREGITRGYIELRVTEYSATVPWGVKIFDDVTILNDRSYSYSGTRIGIGTAVNLRFELYYKSDFEEGRWISDDNFVIATLPVGWKSYHVTYSDIVGGGDEIASGEFSTPDREDGATQNITLTIPHVLA